MTLPSLRRTPRLALLATAALAVPLVAATSAQAGYQEFSCTAPANGVCKGSPNLLRAVSAWNEAGTRVGAGASPTGSISDLVDGAFTWADGYACRMFSGTTVLYPMAANGSPTATLATGGFASFGPGSEGC